MTMDPTLLMLSLLFSFAGMGLFMFGKKAQRIPHLVAGVRPGPGAPRAPVLAC